MKKYAMRYIMIMMFCLTLLVLFKGEAFADEKDPFSSYVGTIYTKLVFQKNWDDNNAADRPSEVSFEVTLTNAQEPIINKPELGPGYAPGIFTLSDENDTYVPYWDMFNGKTLYYGYYPNSVKEEEIKGYTFLGEEIVYIVNGEEYDALTYEENVYGDKTRPDTCIVTFTNVRNGDLILTKEVTGTDGDKDKEFHFTITLENEKLSEPINGTYGDATFTDGVASVTMKHDDEIKITDIPGGTTYEVVEEEANQDGYETSSVNEAGEIPKGDSVTVTFTNQKDGSAENPADSENPAVPKTGDAGNMEGNVILFVLSSILLGAGFYQKRNKERH